ncbi:MAG: ABC transporter permease [Oscillospiraceae bacterium]|nr:ABC transporter permease [Oscillospiraceae bacterium]
MTKYLMNRILRALLSVILVVAVVMVMVYAFLDRESVFASDPNYPKMLNNKRQTYMMQQWEKFGYLDYVPYTDFLIEEVKAGNLTRDEMTDAAKIGATEDKDSEATAKMVAAFTEKYKSMGYEVERLPGLFKIGTVKYKEGGDPSLYAYKDVPLTQRLVRYFTGLIQVDNIHNVDEITGERGLTFTWYDPAYGGKKFSPAIMGNGTTHKYLLYFDNSFPYIHQNLVTVNLGISFSVNNGIDVFSTMTDAQGPQKTTLNTYPSGAVEVTADDLHSLVHVPGSLESGGDLVKNYYVDDYTGVTTTKSGMSQMGYSFAIGILSVIMAYLLAVPLGITMALNKDKLVDKLGTLYIIFIMAVPSLGYIFIFRAIGSTMKLPTTFNVQTPTWLMYVLPVVSLALPSIANLMKWLRRYMIDQMNADYVKFARSGGLSEGQIFSKHVLKNAIIPIVHGIPASVLGALTGAIITERVYMVPGIGNVLTTAINKYDNGVIVGVTLFYALLSVASFIMGDVLMSMMDPRISFTAKQR